MQGPPPATAFASFLGTSAPGRRRRWLVLSVVGHLAALLLIGGITLGRPAPPPPPPREPVFVRLGAARASAAKPSPAAPKPKRQRRPPPPVAPIVAPAPVVPPEVPEEEEEPSSEEPVAEPAAAGGPARAPGGVTDGVLQLREVARPPSVLAQATPQYPREARSQRIEGLVVLRVIIGIDGKVEPLSIRVVRSIPALDGAAIAALTGWRFSPAIAHGGQAVRVVIEIPFQFFLR